MLKSLLKRVFGSANDRYLKSFSLTVNKINELEEKYQSFSDTDFIKNTQKLKSLVQKQGKSLDDVLPEAFASVREAAKRVLGQRHYDVQLIGGIALHKGMISEMKTGEGKTLASTLPAYLNALNGKGVHIVTVNDYLASRDSEWMGKVYKFLGLTVGCITHKTLDDERKEAYQCDILYATNNELGFDYLRDNMKHSSEHCVQKEFNYAIIDEIDSILIDEARTPLVISGPSEDRSDLYNIIDKLVVKLVDHDFEKDEKSRTVSLTDEGVTHIESLLAKENLITENTSLFDIDNVTMLHHVNQSLKAHKLFANNVDYLIKDRQVMIIDEFTGRVMEGRRFSEGLHQALEAKENVDIQNENQTLASITFQNYFRLYPKLSGMTGTAMTEAAEFHDIYNLQVVSIPTKNSLLRKDEDDLIYRTQEEKYNAIIEEIEVAHAKNQPILVGTISIEKSEHISSLLKKKKIKHNVLNAKHHEAEASIISQAGRPGAVTIATNMAGRGTDIMLGGNAELLTLEKESNMLSKKYQTELSKIKKQVEKEKKESLEAGGLLVIGTERHESRRIDNQLRGRSGRMGDPGRSIFYLSLEDDLMRIFASDKISSILKTLGLKKGEAIFHPMISRTIAKAQKKVEIRNYEIRKNLLKFDDVMNDQRKVIYQQRNDVISNKNIHDIVIDICSDINNKIVTEYLPDKKFKEEWDIEGIQTKLEHIYGYEMNISNYLKENEGFINEDICKYLNNYVKDLLNKKQKHFGKDLFHMAEKRILLITIDQMWKDHLLSLDHLRHGIYLRAYAQKDPLNEYKREAFEYFSGMLDQIQELYITRVMRMEIDEDRDYDSLNDSTHSSKKKMFESRQDPADTANDTQSNKTTYSYKNTTANPSDPNTWGKVGRNDSCPCGSNKKYKHCHGNLKAVH